MCWFSVSRSLCGKIRHKMCSNGGMRGKIPTELLFACIYCLSLLLCSSPPLIARQSYQLPPCSSIFEPFRLAPSACGRIQHPSFSVRGTSSMAQFHGTKRFFVGEDLLHSRPHARCSERWTACLFISAKILNEPPHRAIKQSVRVNINKISARPPPIQVNVRFRRSPSNK